MQDTFVAEPLRGRTAQELIGSVTGWWYRPQDGQSALDELAWIPRAMSTGATVTYRQPTITAGELWKQEHLVLFRFRMKAKVKGVPVSPQPAVVDTSEAAFRNWVKARLAAKETTVGCLMETVNGAPLEALRFGDRLRRRQRIPPKPLSGHRWQLFAPDEWCTFVGVSDGQLLGLFDNDPRFLQVLPEDYRSEALFVSPSDVEYSPSLTLPRLSSDAFVVGISHEASLIAQQALKETVEESTRPSAVATAKSSRSQKQLQNPTQQGAVTNVGSEDGGESTIPPFRPCHTDGLDGTKIRTRALSHTSEKDATEMMLLCQRLPANELLPLVIWVLERYGIVPQTEDTLGMMLRLLKIVKDDVDAYQARYHTGDHFEMPTALHWRLHQQTVLVEREAGNREYMACLEKDARRQLLYQEQTRAARLKSIFEDTEELIDYTAQGVIESIASGEAEEDLEAPSSPTATETAASDVSSARTKAPLPTFEDSASRAGSSTTTATAPHQGPRASIILPDESLTQRPQSSSMTAMMDRRGSRAVAQQHPEQAWFAGVTLCTNIVSKWRTGISTSVLQAGSDFASLETQRLVMGHTTPKPTRLGSTFVARTDRQLVASSVDSRCARYIDSPCLITIIISHTQCDHHCWTTTGK